MSEFVVNASVREQQGTGASRRLRREGKIPAIIYGGKSKNPTNLVLEARQIARLSQEESFYSSVLTLDVAGKEELAVIMDIQRHPAKNSIMHVDFERVNKTTQIHKKVPLHFVNEAKSAAVKAGGIVEHVLTEVEVTCQAKDLPEFIEVDVVDVKLGGVVHLSDLQLPKGVKLLHEVEAHTDADAPVVSIKGKGGAEATEEAEGEE